MRKSIIKTITSSLFEGSVSRKRVSPMQASLVLALLLCLLMPQGANASYKEYDFAQLAQKAYEQNGYNGTIFSITMGENYSGGIDSGQYGTITSFGDFTVDLSKFAFRNNNNNRGWTLNRFDDYNKGLYWNYTTPDFAITNLRPDDEVTVYYRSNGNRTATFKLKSGSASWENGSAISPEDQLGTVTNGDNNFKFKATAKGDIIIYASTAAGTAFITKIAIYRPDVASYNYDPAKEVYDLTQQNNGSASMSNTSAGYNLNNSTAYYIANSGYELNKRVAITSTSDLSWNSGLKYSGNSYSMVSISNLNAADRVKITYSDGNIIFANEGSVANGDVFLDFSNDGEQDDTDDVTVAGGNSVSSVNWYTMLEDGHIDLVLLPGAKITKIEIVSDHKATYLDTDNGDGSHTLTFDGTGQLVEKTAYIPGLRMEFGDASKEAEHFFVTLSDAGYVSTGVDYQSFKMARTNRNGDWQLEKVPVTGTYYKFIPEISGTLKITFKALSVSYGYDIYSGSSANESVTSASCPYVFVREGDDGNISQVMVNSNYSNGATVTNYASNSISLEKGKTYYFYGWWPNGNLHESCGVAKLISATYTPSFMMPELACVTENGATSFDGSTSEPKIQITGSPQNLNLRVKRASENIDTSNISISLDSNGYMQITGIDYKDESKDKAGVILVSATANEGEHVFALTIPYSAAFNNGEGHRWDFYSKPLEIGNYFSDFYANSKVQAKEKLTESDIASMGKNEDSQLYSEIEKESGTDWTFTYRVVGSGGGVKDPMFQNVYDMCGDNADMIWETEGLWFDTPSNKSAIMNERLDDVDKTSSTDPDRYVAILPGSSFTIPALNAGDRVLIKMGSGDGSGDDACKLNITGALDAIGQEISPADVYNAGGTLWDYSGGTFDYRSAYHFISAGGDMTFTMNAGSITKLYAIEIYKGDMRYSTDATRVASQTYNGETYNANAWWLYNDYRTEPTKTAKAAYQLHFRGKGQRGRTPTVLHKSGNINTDDNLIYAELGNTNAPFILFKSEKEQYGMFRMRIDDMELNNKYVAQYGLQNVTVGYLEKKDYPYTWDFTDLMDYADTSDRIQAERTNVNNYAPKTTETNGYDIEFMNNSVGEGVKSIEQWKSYAESGDIPAGYGLHVRNEKFNGGVMWESGQLYAGDQQFDETLGLSISAPGVHETYNGGLRITEEGLSLTGGNWKITIPEVGTDAAVYVRATPIGSDANAGVVDGSFGYAKTATDNSGDKIYAVKGTDADMTLFFNNVIIKKIAISTDAKSVNKLGYASESRDKEIDPELMGYMTGTGLKAYTVTKVEYNPQPGNFPTVTLTAVDKDPNKKYVIGAATHHDHNAYIIYNTDETTKAVKILDNGFHLFVPDMHDKSTVDGAKKEVLPVSGNGLRAWLPEYDSENSDYDVMSQTYNYSTGDNGSITATGAGEGVNDYTTYVLSSKGINTITRVTETDVERFRRVAAGTHAGTNKAYLPLLTAEVKPSTSNDNTAKGMFAIVFVDEEEGTETTSLNGVESTVRTYDDGCYYTLDGVKVQNPTKKGIYIKNGKKIIIK